MLTRTHLAVGAGVAFYFIPHVRNKVAFFFVVMLASLLPDIDSGFSNLGKRWVFRPVQWTTKHRGIIHTYTVCIALTIILALFFPLFALPFFLGYSFHLFADSFTPLGITPYWPYKKKSSGMIRTGGKVESAIFYTILIFDLLLLIKIFF